jgi:membrane fusion protein (multidrug efflux system)
MMMTTHMTNHTRRADARMTLTALTVSLAVSLATLSACERPKPGLPVIVPTVTTALVGTRDIAMTRDFPATLTSPEMVDINARVTGWLLEQSTPDGATVKKGQLLYSIDPSQYSITLDSANAQLAQSSAQVEVGQAQLESALAQQVYAQATFDRNKPLVATGAVSKETFDGYTANLAEAIASVEQARANIQLYQANELAAKATIATAQLNLSYCTVESPLDGIMGASKFFEGSLVGDGGKQTLNTVVQMDPMWASFSPSANFLPSFLVNQAAGSLGAKVTLTGASAAPVAGVRLSLGRNSPSAEGRLVMVDNEVSETSDTILMRVEFPNPTSVFRPGAYVTVTVELGVERGAIVVPVSAVFARQTEMFVWKVNTDDTVESVAVQVVSAHEKDLVISGGVTPGTRIVTQGVAKLRAGMKVNDVTATAASTPAASTPAASTPATSTTNGKN